MNPTSLSKPTLPRVPLRTLLPASLLSLAASAAHAHEGHGVDGTHWHAFDTLGFVFGTLMAVGALIWLRGRR